MAKQPHPDGPRRAFLKCCHCRDEHKKCLPLDRDWDGQQEKCDRCRRLGRPCGPSARKRKRSVSAPNNVGSTASQSRPAETSSNHESPTCPAKLAFIISTHEILLSQLLLLQERPASEAADLETLNNAMEQIHRAFKRAFHLARKSLENTKGLERELLGLQLGFFDAQHEELRNIKSSNAVQSYVHGRKRRTAYLSCNTTEARILSCSSQVFHNFHTDSQMPLETSHLKLEHYHDLASHMKILFQEIHEVDNNRPSSIPGNCPSTLSVQGLHAFPAPHIAYFNQDRKIALNLWEQPSEHVSDVDVLGRSFVHVVAASKDCDNLANILSQAPGAMNYVNHDKLGLGNDSDSRAMQDILRAADSNLAANLSYHRQSRPTSADLARRAEIEEWHSFGFALLNGRHPSGEREDALSDLEQLQCYPPDGENFTNMNMDYTMDFCSGLPTALPGQSYSCGYTPTYEQNNTLQPAQSSNGHIQSNQPNSVYPVPNPPRLDYACIGCNCRSDCNCHEGCSCYDACSCLGASGG